MSAGGDKADAAKLIADVGGEPLAKQRTETSRAILLFYIFVNAVVMPAWLALIGYLLFKLIFSLIR